MKTLTSLQFATFAALLAVGPMFAQTAGFIGPDGGAGLLGYKHNGIEFGYTHHVESEPKSLHRYGFVSHAPMPEMAGLDGAFRYDYTRGSSSGLTSQTHQASAALVRYFIHRTAKPFVDVAAGWAWRKRGPVKEDSFLYRGAVGIELGINPDYAVTPFVSFHDAANLGAKAWNYGAKLAYRIDRNWIPTLRVQVDDAHNIEYTLAVNHRY
jgi:hypothetical protein